MTPGFRELYSSHAVAAFDRQLALAGLVGDLDWRVDVPAVRLTFGDTFRWSVQFLGTESHADGTWLWAWANPSGLPAHGLVAALTLREAGTQGGVPEFASASFPLSEADGHALALVASGLCRASAYYRCPYEGGALFVLVADDNFPECDEPPIQRIATVFPQALAALDLHDHRVALAGYLDAYQLAHERGGDAMVVQEDGGPVLTATFDEQNRLTALEVRVAVAGSDENAPDETESWDQAQLRRMLGG